MCCVFPRIEFIANTNIFARGCGVDQFLVYSMTYASSSPVAMVLPIPVPANSPEDAVEFINLERYPRFFDDMQRGFPPHYVVMASKRARFSPPVPMLKVHAVGCYDASFVPTFADFRRLDERFRIPAEAWERLPEYHDFGFAVFQLRETLASGPLRLMGAFSNHKLRRRRVHPMAFRFPRRNPESLYFPTVHIHDGKVHEFAKFDHMLYCQADSAMREHLNGWMSSDEPASSFIGANRTQGIVDPNAYCWRFPLVGRLENKDAVVGRSATLPMLAMSARPRRSRARRTLDTGN